MPNLKLKRQVLWCDPPDGWMFGFPKEYNPNAVNVNQRQWLIDNGYPEERMNQYGDYFYVRWFYTEEDFNKNEYV